MQNFNQPTLRPPHAPSRPRCDHPPSRPSSLLPPHHSTSRPPLSVTVLLRYVVDVTPHRSSLLLLLLLLLLVSSRCCHHCRSPITDPPPSCHRVTISRHFLARCITIRYGHHQPIHPSSSLSSSLSSSSSSSSSLSSSLSSSSLSSSSSSSSSSLIVTAGTNERTTERTNERTNDGAKLTATNIDYCTPLPNIYLFHDRRLIPFSQYK